VPRDSLWRPEEGIGVRTHERNLASILLLFQEQVDRGCAMSLTANQILKALDEGSRHESAIPQARILSGVLRERHFTQWDLAGS
jgi:hypothetical protein